MATIATLRRPVRMGFLACATILFVAFALLSFPSSAYSEPQQTPDLFRNELQIIALVNRERRQNGLLPLRWNRELTLAARTFAADAVESLGPDYCGHTDSQGASASDRMRKAGFAGLGASAENVDCRYDDPATAVQNWMNSPGHRANILNPSLREAGVGYYSNAGGASYIVLDMAQDPRYAPVVINDEALTTTDTQVQLTIYDQNAGDDWQGVGATLAMMISNSPDFAGATWEPYAAARTWTLDAGEGWKTVYVKTRDRLGRTTLVQDSIYLGAAVPDAVLSLAYASKVDPHFTLQQVAANGYTHIQFSLDWLVDDTDANLQLVTGKGERINDPAAVGGSSYRMKGGDTTMICEWARSPFGDMPATAYFRLKIADNTSTQEVLKLTAGDGKTEVASLSIRGVDFKSAGQFQEFSLPFTLPKDGSGLLVFSLTRNGSADVYWDRIGLYTAPLPITSPLTYRTYNDYYRSQGIEARLVTPSQSFSDAIEINPNAQQATPNPGTAQLAVDGAPATPLMAQNGGSAPQVIKLSVTCTNCGDVQWQAAADVSWLSVSIVSGQLVVQADPTGLADGVYVGYVTISVPDRPDIAALRVPISLLVGAQLTQNLYLPALSR